MDVTSANGKQIGCHGYHDYSNITMRDALLSQLERNTEMSNACKINFSSSDVPFPTKLHIMLTKAEDAGFDSIISWQKHGRAFVVHEPHEFVKKVMPLYFNQTKLASFQRQLNLYGFRRIKNGKDRGGYYHEQFLRNKLFLCSRIPRIRIKGNLTKGKTSPDTEPDFYKMPPIMPDADSRKKPLHFGPNEEKEIVSNKSRCNGDDYKSDYSSRKTSKMAFAPPPDITIGTPNASKTVFSGSDAKISNGGIVTPSSSKSYSRPAFMSSDARQEEYSSFHPFRCMPCLGPRVPIEFESFHHSMWDQE